MIPQPLFSVLPSPRVAFCEFYAVGLLLGLLASFALPVSVSGVVGYAAALLVHRLGGQREAVVGAMLGCFAGAAAGGMPEAVAWWTGEAPADLRLPWAMDLVVAMQVAVVPSWPRLTRSHDLRHPVAVGLVLYAVTVAACAWACIASRAA